MLLLCWLSTNKGSFTHYWLNFYSLLKPKRTIISEWTAYNNSSLLSSLELLKPIALSSRNNFDFGLKLIATFWFCLLKQKIHFSFSSDLELELVK